MTYFEEKDGCIILTVKVIPRAAKDSIQGVMGDILKIRIQAPPVEGRANTYLVKFLSKQWNIPRASIKILAGKTGRNKSIRISNPSDDLRVVLLSMETD